MLYLLFYVIGAVSSWLWTCELMVKVHTNKETRQVYTQQISKIKGALADAWRVCGGSLLEPPFHVGPLLEFCTVLCACARAGYRGRPAGATGQSPAQVRCEACECLMH